VSDALTLVPPRLAPSAAPSVRRTLQQGLLRLDAMFDAAFGARANPWRHLGALSFFLFWVVAATGIYVYAAFDTSVTGAYASVERISADAWPFSRLARSLHRYASDAFVVAVLLHLGREWLGGHARGFRWFSWLTGVPLLWLLYASGVGGYWLVWDAQAQFSLIATTEWLDALPLFGEPLVRNFIAGSSVSDRFFSLLIFLHIGIPLLLLLGMWVHIQRISRPRTNPPRALALGLSASLAVLALVKPAVSGAPADLSLVPAALDLDWFYLAPNALLYATSGGVLWALCGGATLLLALLPWLPRAPRAPAARVDLANCNGCGRCFADCPYAAVTLEARTDGKSMPLQAVVDPDLCAACGICAGACPSSTPFRSAGELVSGIDMPQRPMRSLRAELERATHALRGNVKLVVFGCDCAAEAAALAAPDTAVVSLLCTAMLPPSFVEYALRTGADGVLITGCRDGDCQYRLGNRWTEERLAGRREPHLRALVPRVRVHVAWAGPTDAESLGAELERFRRTLESLPALARTRSRAPKRTEVLHV
jgi:quinol-cytochrome oxidoreductase complex cytochrome b subunit/coenzyme F420-reducing hydrogenase delta subunit/Fe-S-cluster-containing dehydrogenase component